MQCIVSLVRSCPFVLFFFNDPATTEIYTLSLHDALPILSLILHLGNLFLIVQLHFSKLFLIQRSEERFSRNAETDLVCRLLLEKKKLLLGPVRLPTACSRLAFLADRPLLVSAAYRLGPDL